jgi:hypothetical protein
MINLFIKWIKVNTVGKNVKSILIHILNETALEVLDTGSSSQLSTLISTMDGHYTSILAALKRQRAVKAKKEELVEMDDYKPSLPTEEEAKVNRILVTIELT